VSVVSDGGSLEKHIRGLVDEMNTRFALGVEGGPEPDSQGAGAGSPALPRLLRDYEGAGYARPSAEELRVLVDAAREEGLLLDPVYTGRAFFALTEEIRKGELTTKDCVVFVHTGGGFGVFDFAEELSRL
jgi:1-aminocyclopropane-1-carboxylate deaminase/D-cysteine desulfhydrase-like pyridoxal-dependent ACC family enzyme